MLLTNSDPQNKKKYFRTQEIKCNISEMFQIISSVIIDSDNALAPSWRQAIIHTNVGLVYWRIYLSLRLNELTHIDVLISCVSSKPPFQRQ